MKKYDTYKDSKLRFNGEIPLEWDEAKIKHYFEIGRGRVISQLELKKDGIYPVFSSQTKNDGCMGYIDTYDFDEHQLTWTTDGANAGEVFERIGRYNCTNVCGTLKPKKNLSIRFFLYQLQYLTKFYKRPDTNGAKIMNNEMAEIHCLIPSLIEQKTIASFLDHKTTQINTLIEKKEQLVEKLTLKRQAIINEAVTKGLNPDVPMKDSGIEWLGEIPEHWEVVSLKYLVSKVGSGVTPRGGSQVYQDSGIMLLRSQNIYSDGLRLDDVAFISNEIDNKMSNSRVKQNDVLLNITGASIGRCFYWERDDDIANVNQHVCIIRPLKKHLTKYMHLLMVSEVGQTQIFLGQDGTSREGLNFEEIKSFTLAIPPKNEIENIIDNVESRTNQIDTLIEEINISIEKLKLYRQSLISEAVTGKIDLRDWKQKDNK